MSDAQKRLTRDSQNMRKSAKKKTNQIALPEIELVEDAWPRFEVLVKSAAKMGHRPHEASKKNKSR